MISQPVIGTIRAIALIGTGALLCPGTLASAGKLRILYSGTYDTGYEPTTPLAIDGSGTLHGTTSRGGKHYIYGTAFSLTPNVRNQYAFKYLQSFNADIENAFGAGLILDTNGNLWGQSYNGAYLLFHTENQHHHIVWSLAALSISCPAKHCGHEYSGGLTYAGQSPGTPYDGRSPLYGVTFDGGTKGSGSVFELTQNGNQWIETVLYSFCSTGDQYCTDGDAPESPPLVDNSGNLFGTTSVGGQQSGPFPSGTGVAYEISPDGNGGWNYTVLWRFCSFHNCADGEQPVGTLVTDSSGNLFGATQHGGHSCPRSNFGCGTIFQLTPNGQASQLTVLHTFCRKQDCADGAFPVSGLSTDANGDLYGTTEYGGGNDNDQNSFGGGTLFQLNSTSFKVLHSFCAETNCADGEYPVAVPITDLAGNIYGTTQFGGDINLGTVFQLRP